MNFLRKAYEDTLNGQKITLSIYFNTFGVGLFLWFGLVHLAPVKENLNATSHNNILDNSVPL